MNKTMKNTIYTVKGGKTAKLSKLENSVYEFFTSDEFLDVVKVGDSYSEKKLKNQFASWNDENLTVAVSTLLNEKNVRRVCLAIASDIKNGLLTGLSVVPTIHVNKADGTFSVDFVDVENLDAEYSAKELTPTERPSVDPTEFVINYITKHADSIDMDLLKNTFFAD